MTLFHCEAAWLGGSTAVPDVAVHVADGLITNVERGVKATPDAIRLRGIVLPGLANAHSHAFHRALRGRSQAGAGDFWTWREAMYGVAGNLDPARYLDLARAVYAEMAMSGITAVGEFHYLHHDVDGRSYADNNEMAHALVAAARDAGVRLCLIDTCYLRAGFDGPGLSPVQERFADPNVDAWATRFEDLVAAYDQDDDVTIAVAAHSVRAVAAEALQTVAATARAGEHPFHMHLSEQPAENDACIAATGGTPTQVLLDAEALDSRTVAVHATHLTDDDVTTLGREGVSACFCPTTERDLGDGIGPARQLVEAGTSLCLGSDSHAMIDLFEEARAVELHERLVSRSRGVFSPDALLLAATANGHRALGMTGGRIEVGAAADLVSMTTESVRMAGVTNDHAAAHLAFTATAADVTDVVVAGDFIVRDRLHLSVSDVPAALASAIRSVLPSP